MLCWRDSRARTPGERIAGPRVRVGAHRTRPPLITPAFVALAAATLAFYIASGIVLPARRCSASGSRRRRPRVRGRDRVVQHRLARAAAGRRLGHGPLRASAVADRRVAPDRGCARLHVVAVDLPLFIAARCILGAAEGSSSALAAAGDLAPEGRRGESLSFLSLSLYLGVAIGPPMAEVVRATGSFTTVWLTAGGLDRGGRASLLVPETAPSLARPGAPTRPRLIHPAGVFPGVVILLGLSGMACFLTFLPLYAPEIGMDGAAAARRVRARRGRPAIVGARGPIGSARPACPARRSPCRRSVSSSRRLPNPIGLLVGTAVFASGVAFIMPALLARGVARPADERGTVVGTATLFLDVSFGIAPAVLGVVADRSAIGRRSSSPPSLAGLGASCWPASDSGEPRRPRRRVGPRP